MFKVNHQICFLTLSLGLGMTLMLGESPCIVSLAQDLSPASAFPPPAFLTPLIENTTVRVYAGKTAGSGVIVARSGSRYQVLTNRHVVEWGDRLQVLTADGQFQPAQILQTFAGLDLAVVTFQSDRLYAVAPLSSSLPPVGTPIYAAGFPLYQAGQPQDTTGLGRQTFQITSGSLTWLLNSPLPEGYRLGYSNPVAIGMSGGPLFNAQGQVVGINGRSAGRDAGFGLDTLGNGQPLDPILAAQMAELSWGIPVAGGIPGLAIIPQRFEPAVNFEPIDLEPISQPSLPPTFTHQTTNQTTVSPVNSSLLIPAPLEPETVPDSIQPSETLNE